MKGQSIQIVVNGTAETIRFSPYRITSQRMPYDIEQEYGLDEDGKLSRDFVPFEADSTESRLIAAIRSGDIQSLVDHGLILCERPGKGKISRNLAIYDPDKGLSYTIGGLGFLSPDVEDHRHFFLKDPLLDRKYADYQESIGNSIGGTKLVDNEGFIDVPNKSIVGTIEYNSGPYHVVRKIQENEKLKALGINAPTFIAAGPIKNIAEGKYGFSLYRSPLSPEYLLNVSLYLDEGANFKKNFQYFLESKYGQLAKLHREIGETHGQPSNTNTLVELDISRENDNLTCQIKDFETNHPLPTNTDKIIHDGLCPIPLGYDCEKSPHAAAMIYDLQHALMQELNVLFLPLQHVQGLQDQFNYISNQSARMLRVVAKAYGIASEAQQQQAIDFAVQCLHAQLKNGVEMSEYNKIIAGAFVHQWFANSAEYQEQITINKTT